MDIAACVHVVEDDDAVRDSLQMMLESIGYRVQAFASADSFLDAYSQDMAGCIVLDIRMPGMNGMELHRKLNEINSILPIIFAGTPPTIEFSGIDLLTTLPAAIITLSCIFTPGNMIEFTPIITLSPTSILA